MLISLLYPEIWGFFFIHESFFWEFIYPDLLVLKKKKTPPQTTSKILLPLFILRLLCMQAQVYDILSGEATWESEVHPVMQVSY